MILSRLLPIGAACRRVAACILLVSAPFAQATVDQDGDGMSDVWALKYGASGLAAAGDADGDGISNGAEATAGTNPFGPGSVIKISAMWMDAQGVHFTFGTAVGKRYQLQSAAIVNATTWAPEGPVKSGTGAEITVLVATPGATERFYRVLVQDIDSDGDGASDWEEIALGFNPNSATSQGGQNDFAAISQGLQAPSVVTIEATDPRASEAGADPGQFRISRSGGFAAITVQYARGGSAAPGSDYQALSGSAEIPFGGQIAIVPVTPIADTAPESNEAVVATISADASYTAGTPSAAAVLIADETLANGDGLRAQFYNEAATLSATEGPTFSAEVTAARRVDPTVNFSWPGSTAPATGVGSGDFSCRWTGEVMPEFSEVYTFQVTVNAGGRLWVNGELLINKWSNTPGGATDGASTLEATIELEAGRRYPIIFEHYDWTGDAEARLRWKSLHRTLEIIPQARLFSASSAAVARPHITSPLSAAAYLGAPAAYSYQIMATGNPTSFSAANLPPGLSANAAGLISGTPTLPGVWHVAITATNAAGSDTAILALTVSAGGTITRELWNGIAGGDLDDIPLHSAPASTATASALEAVQSAPEADGFGQRLRGFLTAPVTGPYEFWLAGDHAAELLISDDADEFKATRRAQGLGATAFRDWEAAARSLPIWLVGGQRYYVEVRHKEATGADHVSVGWLKPGQTGAVPSEVVPGYVLSSYTPPAGGAFDGTFYTTNLLPQTGVVTTATGSATLRLNAAETQAILTVNYGPAGAPNGGLTSPLTSWHVHSGAHGAAEIFDLDEHTPVTNGPGNYVFTWDIVPVSPLQTAQEVVDVIKNGDAYLNIHSAIYPNGEIKGYFKQQAASQTFIPPPAATPAPDDHTDPLAAARFLTQATFGPSPASIAQLTTMAGYDAWITTEFAKSPTLHLPSVLNGGGSDPTNAYPGLLSFNTWWQRAITADDQLRQRVAFALSEILVASEEGPLDNKARAVSHYYDTLLTHAFGNFRDLLEAITLTPGMGLYLDMRKNDKPDTTLGRIPNENYAREIMQLFSIGLNRMHPDATLKLDANSNVIPTYTQDEIVGLSHVFTGWNYNQFDPANPPAVRPTGWSPGAVETAPMTEVPTHHFTGPKRLLNNTYLPGLTVANGQRLDPWLYTHPTSQTSDAAYQTLPTRELDLTHDLLFHHPNTAPFICRQLIQRLVTSTPSRGYIHRVVRRFENNGSGVRGDLQAVIRAILTDFEARSPVMMARETFGKQREPVLRVTALGRAFPAPPDATGTYSQTGNLITLTVAGTNIASSAAAFVDFSDGAEGDPEDQSYTLSLQSGNDYAFRPIGTISGGYVQAAGTSVMTVDFGSTQHAVSTGGIVYLDFANSTGANPMVGTLPADGFYQITAVGGDSTAFTIPIADTSAKASATGTGATTGVRSTRATDAYGALRGTYSQPANSTVATITVISGAAHNIPNGTTVLLDFTSGSTPDGTLVATVTSPTTFDVTPATTSTSARTGSVTIAWNGADITRTGNVTVAFSSFRVDSTNTELGQTPLQSPTVFNFFEPDYVFSGPLAKAQMITPEFQLSSETNVIRQAQVLLDGIRNTSSSTSNLNSSSGNSDFRGVTGLTSFKAGGGAITLDLRPWMGIRSGSEYWTSNANLPALIEELNKLLCAGQLTPGLKTLIENFVKSSTNITYTDANPTVYQRRNRVRAVVQLIATSPDFSIQK